MSATNMVGETERSRDPAASAPPDEVSMQDDEYTCVLRIDGSALDLVAIDAVLGLRGQHDHVNRSATQWRTAVDLQRWQYPMGEGGDGTYRSWSSLEDALCSSVESLFPVRSRLESYVEHEDVYWWIGCFHRARSSLIYLTHDLIEKLAAIGAPVYLDNYFLVSDEIRTEDGEALADEEEDEGVPNHRYRFWIDETKASDGHYPPRPSNLASIAEDTDFAMGIQQVLDRIEEHRLHGATSGARRVLVCEHVQNAFDGGPVLSRAYLGALADLDVDVALVWTS
jgi:hypothetical protein